MNIFPKITPPIRRILVALKTETEVRFPITYKRWDSQTRNGTTGKWDNAYTDHAITAIRLRHTDESIRLVGSRVGETPIQQGDIIYMIDSQDFPATFSLKDLVDTGSRMERVRDITPVYGLIHMVTTESGGS